MGFKQRQAKRTKKAAIASAQAESRHSGSAESKWWLTVATRKACCNRCGGVLKVGAPIVFRRVPCELLCPLCGEVEPYRPSRRWELRGRGGLKGGDRRDAA